MTYPSGLKVQNVYDTYGYLSEVRNAQEPASRFWYAPIYTADGQVTANAFGNGLVTVNQYDPATGRLIGISTGVVSGSATQYLTYTYDTLGNLKQRVDGNQNNLTETFGYDNLNRLTSATIASIGTVNVTYDPLGTGNIASKSDVGAYTYDPVHKHAVKTAGSGSYTYDANGNQLTGPNGRSLAYASYNQPVSIIQGGKTLVYAYDADHQRTVQVSPDGVTVYIHPRLDVGGHFERTAKTGLVEDKHYIYAGKEAIAVFTARSNGTMDLRYLHKDHLGSIDAITNETGGLVEKLSYDAWGKRRTSTWSAATGTLTSLVTHHGYTGHEMLDDVGLINMNGRVYDPALGRFLSADPTVQSPGNPQTLNRYSYAGNNPLSYVDPSGYTFAGWLGKKISQAWKSVWNSSVGRAIITIGLAWALGPAGFAIMNPMAAGFTAGLIGSGGDLKTAVLMGVTAGAFNVIGTALKNGAITFGQSVLAHAFVGGTTSVLQGGKFGPGAMSAGFTQFASVNGAFDGFGDAAQTSVRIKNAVAAAVVGGTASVIGGGKFENGAVTSAFAYLFSSAGSYGIGDSLRALGRGALDVVGKIWNLPNTIVGLAYGGVGHVAGWIMGTNPGISFANNAIQFENNPLMASAMSFGNASMYSPDRVFHPTSTFTNSGLPLGFEEMQHSFQGQVLGPLYLPAHGVLGAGALLFNGSWHGPFNILETGPHSASPRPWP